MTQALTATALNTPDFYHQCPLVLTGPAWRRLVYREQPDDPSEFSHRLASIITAAHREIGFSPMRTTIAFGLYHEEAVGDERRWVELLLTVVSLPGEPTYLHLSLITETQQ